jgi:pyruvate dehydrogenase E2 component (dihydrolipoamide acetyltransferase)
MLREFAASFRAFAAVTATTPSAAAGTHCGPAAPRPGATVARTALVLLSCGVLCACGIKGPLRMPPPAPAAAPAEAAAAPAPAAPPEASDPAPKSKAP